MSLLGATATLDPTVAAPGVYAPHRRLSIAGRLAAAVRWIRQLCLRTLLPPRSRRLRVTETVSLGDKRFVSIVEVDGVDFLIGGGTSNVSLLTRLGPATAQPGFEEAVAEAWGQAETA